MGNEKANNDQVWLTAFNCLLFLTNTSTQPNGILTDVSPDTWNRSSLFPLFFEVPTPKMTLLDKLQCTTWCCTIRGGNMESFGTITMQKGTNEHWGCSEHCGCTQRCSTFLVDAGGNKGCDWVTGQGRVSVIYLSLSNPNISLTDASPYNWWRFSLFPSFSSITDSSTNG